MSVPRTLATGFLLLGGVCTASCARPSDEAIIWTTGSVTSVDGVSIHYQTAGDGPIPIVFVHGWSCDRSYWSEQLDHFAAGHRVVALDLGGHGDSGLNRETWTMSAFGADVAAVVEVLDLERAVLVGHSMGGAVVAEAAKQLADRLIGLVVVDNFQNLDESMTPSEIEETLQPWVEDFVGVTQRVVRTMFVPTSDSALIEHIVDDMSSGPPEVGVGAARDYFRWFGENPLEGIGVPVVVINSDVGPTNTEPFERYGLELILMSDVGHFVMMEDPETFNRILAEVLSEFGEKAGTT